MERLFLTLDVGRIAYFAEGQGPPLILLHGLNNAADVWCNVLGRLAQKYAVYAPDTLGHGYSDKPLRDYLVEDYALSTIAFMDRLGLGKITLCGNSFGGLIAVEIAATHPERVEKLILVGCPTRNAWERALRSILFAHRYDAEGKALPISMEELAIHYAYPTPELLEQVNQQRALTGIWARKGAIATAIYDALAKLPLVKCPTLVLNGEGDAIRALGEEKNLLNSLKGSKLALVTDTKHLPQVEQPEAFVQEVNKFLSSSLDLLGN